MENLCGLMVALSEADLEAAWARGCYGPERHYPVPLTKVAVDTSLVDFTAQVKVQQSYVNKEERPIECVYFFPIEEGAAVVDFQATVEDRQLVAQVKKKEEAKADYDAAVESGKTAIRLDQTRPDIFQMSVGHLSPGSACTITITYIYEADREATENGAVTTRLTIPTTIAPKYISASENDSPIAAKIASIEYDFKSPAPLTFALEAKTTNSSPLVGISSHSHSITTEISENLATAKLTGETSDLDRDIVVLIEHAASPSNSAMSKVTVETLVGDGESEVTSVLLLSLTPSFKFKPQSMEIVFLVDCSGSMMGDSIKMAGEALQLFLHSMPGNCYFNIFRFGSSYVSLFGESVRYDDASLAKAKALAKELNADLGGTEIYAPLETIFKQKTKQEMPRQVFVLTDGEVSNSLSCINLVTKYSASNRVFTMGIGSASDRLLVKGMARAGRGSACFTTEGENLAPKVLKQLKHARQPCVQNLNIDWGTPVDSENSCQAPSKLPPVYDGERLQIFRFLDGRVDLPTQIIVTGKLDGSAEDFRQEIAVETGNAIQDSNKLLHKMFARKMIQDLEESHADKEEAKDVEELVTELSLKYGLASTYTSFIAVDTVSKKTTEVMASRQVANQINHGYGGGFGYAAPVAMMACAPPMQMRSMPQMAKCSFAVQDSCAMMLDSASEFESVSNDMADFSGSLSPSNSLGATEIGSGSKEKSNPLLELTALQSASGSFRSDPLFGELMGKSEADVSATIKAAEGQLINVKCGDEVLYTGLALILMEKLFSELKDHWELIAEKALDWMNEETGGMATEVVEALKKLIN